MVMGVILDLSKSALLPPLYVVKAVKKPSSSNYQVEDMEVEKYV